MNRMKHFMYTCIYLEALWLWRKKIFRTKWNRINRVFHNVYSETPVLLDFFGESKLRYRTHEKVIARTQGEIRVIKRKLLHGRHGSSEHAPADECEHDCLYIQRNYVIVSQNRGLRDWSASRDNWRSYRIGSCCRDISPWVRYDYIRRY